MKKLTILGASGHGKVVADIARLNGYDEIEFLDDDESIQSCGQFPVVGNSKKIAVLQNDIFIAIGNSTYRKKFIELFSSKSFPVLIHPDAVLADGVNVGEGTVIMAGSVVNSGTVIGKGCIINTCSSVDHDCRVGNYVHVAVGAHLCGTVTIGDNTWIGAGTTVCNNIKIVDDCMTGAGSVVIKNLVEPGTYVGIPAKIIKS